MEDLNTTIDLMALIEPAVGIVAATALAAGTWAINRAAKWLGLKADDEFRNSLDQALFNGVQAGRNAILSATRESDFASVEVRDQWARETAGYVLRRVPDAVRHFRLSETDIHDLVHSRLPSADEDAAPGAIRVRQTR